MPRVAALYRYPVKGFTPEECETLTVLDEGRIAGDRVLGIRFADTAAADEAWSKKTEMVALMNTPGLARLHLRFEEAALRLRLSFASTVLVDVVLNPEGRKRRSTRIRWRATRSDSRSGSLATASRRATTTPKPGR
jgi:MOSC domain-containing protein